MKARDFVYDRKKLSDFGMILCQFDSGGLKTVDGVKVTFNTVSSLNGKKHSLTSVKYDDCIGTTIQVCKHSCTHGVQEITANEHRELTKWLMRGKFLKFKILDEEHIDLYYEASFISISNIELDGKLVGVELELITNRPFALKEPKTITINNTSKDGKHFINDTSYEEGYIYPYTEITIGNIGNEKMDLDIYNAIEDRHTIIKNCVSGEVITMDYPIIKSTISSHNIQNNFNWKFFRIANTYDNSRNDLTISIPCTMKVTYSPIVKVGL